MKEYLCYWIYRSSLPAEECREFTWEKYCQLLNIDPVATKLKAKKTFGIAFIFLFLLLLFM
ncbi:MULTISPECIES: hypothetical protein [Thermodesulfovibrio]|uniref:hypothetical protein n=1 Tax=Thermodesulfovibrio TaxID=28261 RepID=UPI00261BA95C|nr:hypothetical protein [Thermodesulfovibrio sp.]